MPRSTLPQYLQLNKGGTYARMAILRMYALDWNRNRPPSMAQDWRGARAWRFNNGEAAHGVLSQGMNGKTPVWSHHGGEYFRNERDASDILTSSRHGHCGWFSDTQQSDRVIGIVASLSHGRFIAGYRWTSNNERCYYGEIFDDEDEAARMADEHARVYAELCMEDSERFDQMQNLESELESKLEELRDAIALRNHRRGSHEAVHDLIEEVRDMRATLETEYKDIR